MGKVPLLRRKGKSAVYKAIIHKRIAPAKFRSLDYA